MVKVTTTLIVLVCSVVATHGSPLEDSREAEVMRKMDDLAVAERSVDTWFTEYEAEMQQYTALLTANGTGGGVNGTDESVMCDDPQSLKNKLTTVKEKIDIVWNGINKTTEQLVELENLLLSPDFKNYTGLYELLTPYIDTHKSENEADIAKLNEELTEIATKEADIDSYDCPCVWEQWTEWSPCSVTCGGANITRDRSIERNATNAGDLCLTLDNNTWSGMVPEMEIQECGTTPCPIDCVWSQWVEWDMTPNGCNGTTCGDGFRTTTRPKDIVEKHGGLCPESGERTKPCNTLKELQAEVCRNNCTSTFVDCTTYSNEWTTDLTCSVPTYTKIEKKYCSMFYGKHCKDYPTLNDAIAACENDQNCAYVNNGSCDDNSFCLCSSPSPITLSVSSQTCVYEKPSGR